MGENSKTIFGTNLKGWVWLQPSIVVFTASDFSYFRFQIPKFFVDLYESKNKLLIFTILVKILSWLRKIYHMFFVRLGVAEACYF